MSQIEQNQQPKIQSPQVGQQGPASKCHTSFVKHDHGKPWMTLYPAAALEGLRDRWSEVWTCFPSDLWEMVGRYLCASDPSAVHIAALVAAILDLEERQSIGTLAEVTQTPFWLYFFPPRAFRATCAVLTYGAAKYSPDNWRVVVDRPREGDVRRIRAYWDAALRHIVARMDGEVNDPESGLPHLAHASCCLAFIIALEAEGHDSMAWHFEGAAE